MEKYNKVLSSNYCISIFDGTHDSPKYVLEGFPLVTSKCLINNNIDSSVASLIGQKDYDDVNKRSKVEQNDILISMIGINAGIVGLIKNKPEYAIKNVGVFRCKDCIEAKYLFYYLQSDLGINELKSSMAGSAQPYITLEKLRSLSILVPINRIQQQHIVNTIGSVDDFIENLNQQYAKIVQLCLKFLENKAFNHFEPMINHVKFIKGIEAGSKEYSDKPDEYSIPYYRVGDLNSSSPNVYINNKIKHKLCSFEDILISFDGAPGRINIGCEGAYSSGLQKVECDKVYKGLIFFSLSSSKNQEIIKKHSQGTTILHASKSIEHLVVPHVDNDELIKLNRYFNELVFIKKKIQRLKITKDLLLNKYFTNQ